MKLKNNLTREAFEESYRNQGYNEAEKIYYELLDEKILNHKRKQMTKVQLENEIIKQRFRNSN